MSNQPYTIPHSGTHALKALELDFDWFFGTLRDQLGQFLQQPGKSLEWPPAPPLEAETSPYANLIRGNGFGTEERVALLLALGPTFFPGRMKIFRSLRSANGPGRNATSLAPTDAFIPTGETLLLLLSGRSFWKRTDVLRKFGSSHPLFARRILTLEPPAPGASPFQGRLLPEMETIEFLLHGKVGVPKFSNDFPARPISTNRDWDELVLPQQTIRQVTEIISWVRNHKTVMDEWKMRTKLAPGFRAMFHGPPGTGKTFTATLLGKATGLDVVRIDLSRVVSKYIGETEKNLEKVFEQSAARNWILFFDEAEALFGKRTEVRDAHDRYANQEISFLLQRVEDFDGIVILASNLFENMDAAFIRRFQSIIHFPVPGKRERLRIWQNAWPSAVRLGAQVDLGNIAGKFEMAGGAIMNVVRFALMQTAARGSTVVEPEDIREGISREFRKEGRLI